MIKVYTTPYCPYCVTLKNFLKQQNIEFEEVNVLDDEAAKEEMIKKSGQYEVPVVEIDGEIIIGFDKERILKVLKIKE